jgi:hypothetical protein
MVKAIWNGKVIAEADRTEIVEGNHYFPRHSSSRAIAHNLPLEGQGSLLLTACGRKGERRRRLVLPRTKTRGAKNRRQSRLFERRSNRDLIILQLLAIFDRLPGDPPFGPVQAIREPC